MDSLEFLRALEEKHQDWEHVLPDVEVRQLGEIYYLVFKLDMGF